MDIFKKPLNKKKGFSIRIILGFIFILFGIVIFLELFNVNFIGNGKIITYALKYGTALGSLIGGLYMLFKKKGTSTPNIKI